MGRPDGTKSLALLWDEERGSAVEQESGGMLEVAEFFEQLADFAFPGCLDHLAVADDDSIEVPI